MGVECHWSYGRDTSDPEKAVLPTILFLSNQHPDFSRYGFRGGCIALGWWDWFVRFTVVIPTHKHKGEG